MTKVQNPFPLHPKTLKTSFDKYKRKKKKRKAHRVEDRSHFNVVTYKRETFETVLVEAAIANDISLKNRHDRTILFRDAFVNAVTISGYMYPIKWMSDIVGVGVITIRLIKKRHKQRLREPEYVQFFNMFNLAIKTAVEKQKNVILETAKKTNVYKENSEHLRTIAVLKQELKYAYDLLRDMKERNTRLARHIERANVLLEQNGYSLIPDNLIIEKQDENNSI
jgi:hypothetical protein